MSKNYERLIEVQCLQCTEEFELTARELQKRGMPVKYFICLECEKFNSQFADSEEGKQS